MYVLGLSARSCSPPAGILVVCFEVYEVKKDIASEHSKESLCGLRAPCLLPPIGFATRTNRWISSTSAWPERASLTVAMVCGRASGELVLRSMSMVLRGRHRECTRQSTSMRARRGAPRLSTVAALSADCRPRQGGGHVTDRVVPRLVRSKTGQNDGSSITRDEGSRRRRALGVYKRDNARPHARRLGLELK